METIALGPFAVSPDGIISPRVPDTAPALHFAWRGRACRAELSHEGVHLVADAARIPSTAEPGVDRRRAFDAVRELPPALPDGWVARLLPDHRLRLEASAPLERPANATLLVSALVRFVLALDPYLDRLEAEGVASPSGSPNI